MITDLNTLIPRGLSVYLYYGGDINDRGEIVGEAVDSVTGEGPAFLAIPCDEEHVTRRDVKTKLRAQLRYKKPAGAPEQYRQKASAKNFSSGWASAGSLPE